MPVLFDNLYPTRGDRRLQLGSVLVEQPTSDEIARVLTEHGVEVGAGTVFVDQPRVAFTQATDAELGHRAVDPEAFRGAIRVGEACYVESGLNPAFPSGPVRLTSVRVNDRAPGRITIGDRVCLQGVAVVAYESVEIGDDVMFGPLVTVMDSSGHPLRGRGQPGEAERTTSAAVTIGARAWVGAGATILKGVQVGEDAVIGAQAVVYDDVPPGAVVIGNPARVVKQL